MSIEEYCDILETIARRCKGNLEKTESQIIFSVDDKVFVDEIKYIHNIIDNLKDMNISSNAIYNDQMYEIALDSRVNNLRYFDMIDLKEIEDKENQVKYTLDFSSHQYLLWFLFSLEEKERNRYIIRHYIYMRRILTQRDDICESETISLLEFVRISFRNLITLKIDSEISRNDKEFSEIVDSFRFQFANCFNQVIMPLNNINYPFSKSRTMSLSNTFTAPKRIYISELTNQYYMGLSSSLPFVQFISYYHVIEYYFEKVYNDDMIKSLQDKISSPRFSVKREQDIKEIIKFINKKVHDKNERYDINELEALELVLKKYIEISELLENIPKEAIEYYKCCEVPFSKGDTVDFNNTDNPKLYKKMAARIYKTRNSIIHSKSGEKKVYSPFDDDEDLKMEIPLLRYIAEEIIIKTSRLL